MYDMTRTPAYEVNEEAIIALRPRGNKSESVEWGLVRENFDDQYVYRNRSRLTQDAQKGRSARPQQVKA
jgi:hypothetical protein